MKCRWLLCGTFFIFCLNLGISQRWERCKVNGSPLPLERISHHSYLRSEVLYIPIVFHIVLPPEAEGPSTLRLQSQLDALNDNFNNYQSIHLVPSMFRSDVRLPRIEFCLASEDEDGIAHEGITRTTTSIPNIGQHFFSDGRQSVHHTILGGRDAWDPKRFLNIWIAELESFAARANFPESGRPDEDGIVIDPDFIGKVGVSNARFSEGRTLVHEVGHYFNLQHPWVNSGCDLDDGLEDTPIQDGPYFGCASPFNSRSCGTLDMTQNFMQFGDDPCLFYFTAEQVQMMRSIVNSVRRGLIENGQRQCGELSSTNQGDIQIFYNENNERIIISGLQRDEVYSLRAYDLTGRLARHFEARNRYTAEINTRLFASGIYVVVVEGPNGLTTKKVAVMRP